MIARLSANPMCRWIAVILAFLMVHAAHGHPDHQRADHVDHAATPHTEQADADPTGLKSLGQFFWADRWSDTRVSIRLSKDRAQLFRVESGFVTEFIEVTESDSVEGIWNAVESIGLGRFEQHYGFKETDPRVKRRLSGVSYRWGVNGDVHEVSAKHAPSAPEALTVAYNALESAIRRNGEDTHRETNAYISLELLDWPIMPGNPSNGPTIGEQFETSGRVFDKPTRDWLVEGNGIGEALARPEWMIVVEDDEAALVPPSGLHVMHRGLRVRLLRFDARVRSTQTPGG